LTLTLAVPQPSLAAVQNAAMIGYGNSHPVCRDAVKLVRTLARDDFSGGTWKKAFGKIEWIPSGAPSISYIPMDINNDGTVELVVNYTDMFRSVMWDWLYIATQEQLAVVKKTGSTEILNSESAQLSLRNQVKFTNHKLAVPVSTHIWKRGRKYFLVMKEDFFARENQTDEGRTLPNSLYVGVLLGVKSSQFDPLYKVQRLHPTMICRIVWQ
jgi:hypothetical protein